MAMFHLHLYSLAKASPDSIAWRVIILHIEGKQSGVTVIDPLQRKSQD